MDLEVAIKTKKMWRKTGKLPITWMEVWQSEAKRPSVHPSHAIVLHGSGLGLI